MTNLRPGWALAKVGDVADINVGFAFKSAEYAPGGVRLLRGENVEPGALRWTDTRYWPEAGVQALCHHLVRPGDLILAMDRPVVSAGLKLARARAADCPCLLVQRVARLRGLQGTTDILHHALSSPAFVRHILVGGQTGTQLPHISGKRIEVFEFPMPPLREQRRLTEALESYFTRLDDAVTTLERVGRNLKRYRASVLKSAVEGRLVPTEAALAKQEGRTYEPASVLLERILTERRRRWSDSGTRGKYEEPTPPDTTNLPKLPEGWCWATLEQLITEPLANGRSVPTATQGFPVLRLTALKEGAIDLAERKIGAWTHKEAEPYLVKQGDFLVARGNGSIRLVGRGGLLRQSPDDVAYPDTLIRVRPSSAFIPELLGHFWDSRWIRDQVEKKARTTAGIYKVNQTDLGECILPLMPHSEQCRLLEEIERQTSVITTNAKGVIVSLSRAARLRQSVLKWAFEGRLADQDPKDEPASVLLERIKAERDTAKPAKAAGPQRKAAKKKARA